MSAIVDGRELHAGGPALLKKFQVEPERRLRQAAERFGEHGQAAV